MNLLSSSVPSIPKIRLYFLDALRAFAILMMLQGHFVDTLLAPVYRDLSNPVFSVWTFMRGLTAPLFFTVTGIVFVFLLLKENKPLKEHVRVRKGIRRAFLLLALGYLLKWNIGYLLIMKFFPYHFAVDVLHVIGLALLALIGVYALHRIFSVSFPLISGLLGLTIFLLFPVVESLDWSWLPYGLSNYFTLSGGSVFTLFPWLGYTLLGGVIGSILHYHTALFKNPWMPVLLIGAGLGLHFSSLAIFNNIHQMLGSELSAMWLAKQYVFWRFGHVLMVLGIFVLLELILKKGFPPLILKIGSETLTLYGVHYVILYGTWFGIGLSPLWKHQLTPVVTILGAMGFLSFFILLIAHIEKVRHVLYVEVPSIIVYALRWTRVKAHRGVHHLLLRYEAKAPALAKLFALACQPLFLLFHLLPVNTLRKWSTTN